MSGRTREGRSRDETLSPSALALIEALPLVSTGALVKIGSDGNPADASVTDAQLALDSAKVATLALGGWADLQAQRMIALVSDLDYFWATPTQGLGTSAAWADAYVQGGGKVLVSNQWAEFTSFIVAAPNTSHWAMAARVIHSGGAYNAYVGIKNGTDVAEAMLAGAETSKTWRLKRNGGSGTFPEVASAVPLDTSPHDVIVSYDGTDLKLNLDGVTIATIHSPDDMPTTPCKLVGNCVGSSSTLTVTDFAYGVKR